MSSMSAELGVPFRVSSYTDVIGPSTKVLGTIPDGGKLMIGSVPGCWGPMITPHFRSTHEVTLPVNVEGAEVGDGLALHIDRIDVLAKATSSGVDNQGNVGCFIEDPGIDRKCPNCGAPWPETYVEGIGSDSIRCGECGVPASPYDMTHGYTMVFDDDRSVGFTVGREWTERMARDARGYSGLDRYEEARAHSVLVLSKADLPGVLARVRPFIGNLGTIPSRDLPSSRNAGDIGVNMVGTTHEFSLSEAELVEAKTDGHMDIDSVRAGAVLICPVKVAGGGIYCGDAHAMQGDGELAGHTTDIVAEIVLRAEVIERLNNDGPILLPPQEDLPYLAQPYTKPEIRTGRELASTYGTEFVEEVAPIQVVGTGPNVNEAARNGLERTAALLDEPVEQSRNRATIVGGIEVGRLPGVVTISVLAPYDRLEELGMGHLVAAQYDLAFI